MSNETDQTIQRLLDERLKVLQWMDRLSAASQNAPQDVMERIRRDYQTRLNAVVGQLEGYQDELEQTLSTYESTREQLTDSERQARDKLAEAELRHMVGEFEDGRWTGLQSEITSELSTVRQKLDTAESEIRRLEEVLGLIKNKPNTQVRKAIPLVEPPPPMPQLAEPARAPAPPPEPTPEPEPEPKPEMITPPPAPRLEPVQAAAPTKAMDELAFLKSVTEDEQQGPAASKASGHPSSSQPIAPERVEAIQTRPDRGSSPKKTLKCGECGVMNFPTEWYCERCGAELGAVSGPDASDVQLTARHPKEMKPNTWYPLLVYAHDDDASEAVERDSASRLGQDVRAYREGKSESTAIIKHGAEIEIVPQLPGCHFNPSRASIKWLKSWHCVEFEVAADPSLPDFRNDSLVQGRVAFFVGSVLIGEVEIWAHITDLASKLAANASIGASTNRAYRAIFVSYSRKDTKIVQGLERAYNALGDSYLSDVKRLRSGEKWNPALLQMIDRADVFQLCWSRAAKQSQHVEREWRHALRHQVEGPFIRPTYWESPMPDPPSELSSIHFTRLETDH